MPSNTYGRQVVEALTNKSGGSVAAGDVVIIDTTNNDAFTTSTAGAFQGMVGIAQETIANNGTGRVLTAGYAALVNVNASVTRGNYGKTHTVAKQATDAGASRVAGAFCQFLTGGTTPDAHLFGFPDGSAATSATFVTAHGARVKRASTSFSVGNNTFTAVQFDAEDFDTDTMHDNTTNNSRITIPTITGVTTGLWNIEANGYMDTVGSPIQGDVEFRLNGTTVFAFARFYNSGTLCGFVLATPYVLSATDYIECLLRTTTASGNASYDAAGSPIFSATFLGKVT
ncbi:MAG TPA: hypothetical protein VNM34_04405 [Verrucomicrobiae bacterium]|nr:hypothetical protein [Verrucomicrobiae bacterium]